MRDVCMILFCLTSGVFGVMRILGDVSGLFQAMVHVGVIWSIVDRDAEVGTFTAALIVLEIVCIAIK